MENKDFELIKELLKKDRSIRRFKDTPIARETLEELVGLTRYCASGRNLQPLKYKIIVDAAERELIFPHLKWAGYLADWEGPEEGERPMAYLVQCLDTGLTANCLCDEGLQLQALTLGAAALGIGGCIIKSFNAPKLKEIFSIADELQPVYVLALGFPGETVVIEDISGNNSDDIKYFRTPDSIHHVPKRELKSLLIP